MEAGIADHVWTLAEIVDLIDESSLYEPLPEF
jgi:hypothetical protein